MTSTDIALLALLVFIAGLLYSSVGHAGASGYLASMALFGLAPSVMKPTALALNVLVAAIATTKFHRAGYFSWPIFWPFAVTSIPFAFLGGRQSLNAATYKPLVGLVLVYAAFRLFHDCANPVPRAIKPVPLPAALLLGMVLGFGLIHGFGLSTRLQQLPLGDDSAHILMRIISFNIGVEVAGGTAEEFSAKIKSDIAKITKLIKEARIREN